MHLIVFGLFAFGCMLAPRSAVKIDAWAHDVRHGVNGTIWCNVTGDSIGGVTRWYNVNDTLLTSGCSVVNETYLEYVWPHPQCSETSDMYVFHANFRRLRDCGNWTCQHSTGQSAVINIQPTESTVESTARPDLDARAQNNEVEIDCRMRLTECSFPVPSLSLFVNGVDITNASTHWTESCDLVLTDCSMERAAIRTTIHISEDTHIICLIDSTGMTDSTTVYHNENTGVLGLALRIFLYFLVAVGVLIVLAGAGLLAYCLYTKHKSNRLRDAEMMHMNE